MIYISRYLQHLRYPIIKNSTPEISRQPFNTSKDRHKLFLTSGKTLVPLAPSNNGILPSPLSSILANRIIDFPDLDLKWFADGFPDIINPTQECLYSAPLNIIPVNYIADSDGHYTITGLSKNSFWMKNGEVIIDELKTYAKAGEIIATAMYSYKDYKEYFDGTQIMSKGYWQLIEDFGKINPRVEIDKPLSITSGLTEEECQSLSYTVGYSDGINGKISGVRHLTKSLSQSFTDHFNVNMIFNKRQNINTTIRFDAQKNTQRTAIYQFIRSFELLPSDKAYTSLNNKFNKPESFKDITFELSIPKSTYHSEHLQKVYIMKP